MNYGPYMGIPYYSMMSAPAKTGLFSKLLGGINFSSILTNTQKTLGIVNQAIPVIKQVQPVIKNAKTMFRVMNEFKKNDVPTTKPLRKEFNNPGSKEQKVEDSSITSSINDGPTFFM